jgi:hypothetical protein
VFRILSQRERQHKRGAVQVGSFRAWFALFGLVVHLIGSIAHMLRVLFHGEAVFLLKRELVYCRVVSRKYCFTVCISW